MAQSLIVLLLPRVPRTPAESCYTSTIEPRLSDSAERGTRRPNVNRMSLNDTLYSIRWLNRLLFGTSRNHQHEFRPPKIPRKCRHLIGCSLSTPYQYSSVLVLLSQSCHSKSLASGSMRVVLLVLLPVLMTGASLSRWYGTEGRSSIKLLTSTEENHRSCVLEPESWKFSVCQPTKTKLESLARRNYSQCRN